MNLKSAALQLETARIVLLDILCNLIKVSPVALNATITVPDVILTMEINVSVAIQVVSSMDQNVVHVLQVVLSVQALQFVSDVHQVMYKNKQPLTQLVLSAVLLLQMSVIKQLPVLLVLHHVLPVSTLQQLV